MTSGDVSYTKYRYTRCGPRVPTRARRSRMGVGYTPRGAWGDSLSGCTSLWVGLYGS